MFSKTSFDDIWVLVGCKIIMYYKTYDKIQDTRSFISGTKPIAKTWYTNLHEKTAYNT